MGGTGLTDAVSGTADQPEMAEALRNALNGLERVAPRKACIARMRIIGKLSPGQISSLLGLEEATIVREWRFAKAWLAREVHDVRL